VEVTISSRRTDEQLATIMGVTCDWLVRGSDGKVLTVAASLNHAIETALGFEAINQKVVALTRQPSGDVIIFAGQIQRLAGLFHADRPTVVRETDLPNSQIPVSVW
jgi:hypothetical protein